MTGSWWRGTRLVAGRGIAETVRSKTFKVVTALLLLIAVAAVVLPQLLRQDESTYTLAVVGPVPEEVRAVVDDAVRAADSDVEYLPLADEDAVRRAVEDGKADAGLVADVLYTALHGDSTFAVLVSQSVVALEVTQRLAEAGLTPEQVAALQTVRPPEQVVVGGAEDTDRAGAGFLVGIVLYIAVTLAGSAIATAVAVEKSTRISEVLLAVLRPSQVMVGTVLAVGSVTLGQLLLLTTPLAVAVRVTDAIGLPATTGTDLALALVWFLLGFLMYGFLFAAAGALVNKMNEVSATITPITMMLLAGYLVGIMVTTDDSESLTSVVASLFPLTAPLVMPIRWAGGEVPGYQLVLAMLLTAGAAVLLAALAATVYRRALLVTGRRAKLREVVRQPAAG
ncbi:MAG TPA: ABC transporter permease [Jiangellales bacterium]|nr:ABC transporter permease [Jiangellales bacterium]